MMVCSRIMGSSRFFAPPKIGSQSVSSKKGDPVEPLEGSDYRPVKSKMLTMRNFVLAVFLCTSVGVGVSNATFLQADNGVAMDLSRNRVDQDLSTFSRLLNAASPKALRHFLHELVPATTKPGVVYSERSAMEALCVDSPELASSIVHLAIRQDPGNTTTTITTTNTPTSTSTTPTPTPTSSSTSTISTLPTPSSTSSVESTTTSWSTSSQLLSSTSTASQPQSSTSGQSTLSSISVPPTSTSSSSPLASPSSSSAMIPSPSSTSTMSTLSTIPTTSSSTLVSPAISTSATSTFTSTLPGGAVTTITEVAIVTPEATDGPTSTSSGMGNLQTGSPATRAERPAVELLFGVFIGGALLI